MYKITVDGHVVQDSTENLVISPVLTEKVNSVNSLEYIIPFNDPLYDKYERRISTVAVTYEDTIVFKGRLLSETLTFDGSKKMKFEGELAYLNDIQFPPFEFKGDYPDLFKKIINYYNSKCDDDKTFTIGQINFFDSNNYVTRSSDSYNSCWNVITDKILNYGGYLKLRYVDDVRYIDLQAESGSLAKQKIEFGKNLLDLDNYINTSNVATVLIPLGANQSELSELNDGVERTFTANKLDIKTVNNNVEFIESELINKLGRVEITEIWDDVTIPQNLLTKAKKRLNELILENQTITIKAVDLHWSGEETPPFLIGDIIHTVSKSHNLDTQMILTARTRNLNDPSKDSFSLGTEKKKLTSAINNSIKNEIDSSFNSSILTNIINHQNKLLANGKNGNIIYGYNDYGKLSEIYFIDTNNFNTAKNVLRLNNGGIGFSNNGVYGTYTRAWTIDGVFNTDYIRTGKIIGGSGKFSLDLDTGHVVMQDGDFSGKITSTAGTIAGFVISDQYIQSKNNYVGIGITDNWAFWAGGNTEVSAKFRVTSAGKVYAKDIDISGGNINIGSDAYIGNNLYLNNNDQVGKRRIQFTDSAYIECFKISSFNSVTMYSKGASVLEGTDGEYLTKVSASTNRINLSIQSVSSNTQINSIQLDATQAYFGSQITCQTSMQTRDAYTYASGHKTTYSDGSGSTSVSRIAFASNYVHVEHSNGDAPVGIFWDIGSDVKIKNSIIQSNKNALEDINKIKFYDFYYNKDMKHDELGFIAQQLRNVNCEFVNEFDDETNSKMLIPNRQKLLVYCIKAIQELYEMMKGA